MPYDKGNAEYGEGIFQRLDHFERIVATQISGSNTSVTVRFQVLTAARMKMQIDVSEVRTASIIRVMISQKALTSICQFIDMQTINV